MLSDNPDIPSNKITLKRASAKPKLLELVRTNLRVKHYSLKTEEAYISWIKKFIIFNNKTYPYKYWSRYHRYAIRTIQELLGHQSVHPVRYIV